MSLKEWGEGLVELTECYLKYHEKCIVQKGYAYQISKEIQHPIIGQMTVPYPKDIDLVGVKLDKMQILLVECTEEVATANDAGKLLEKFHSHEKELKTASNAGFGVRMCVSCAKIGKGVNERLESLGIELLTTEEMTKKLLEIASMRIRGEPIMWILRTLRNDGFIQI